MMADVLPEVRKDTELQRRFQAATTGAERHRWSNEIFFCLLYTRPEEASSILQESTPRFPLSEITQWRGKAILAGRQSAFAKAHYALTEALSITEKEGKSEAQADIYLEWAALEMNRSKWSEADLQLERAARIIKSNPQPHLQFRLAIRQGWFALLTHQLPQALYFFDQADRLVSSLGALLSWEDLDYLTLLHSGLGDLYTASGERELARKHYHRVIALCKEFGLTSRLAWHHLHAGTASMALDRWEEAATTFREALALAGPDQEAAQAAAWANLGYTLIKLHDFPQAAQALNQAELAYRKGQEDHRNLATVYNWKAKLAMLQGDRNSVMQHFVRAADYARGVRDNRLLSHICKDISGYFADQKDFQNAFEYLQLYDDLNERAREEEQQRRLMELQVQYDTEKMEKEAETLRAQAVELRLQAMRAQMNPHFLFNALNGIQNFIHSEDADKASRYLAKFAGLVRKSLNLSNTELITLEDEVAFIQDYLFVNQKLRFDGRLEFSVRIDEEIDEDRVVLPPMMIQPFVENAIEHGFIKREKGRVDIHIGMMGEDVLRCTVQDDGIGRKAAIAIRSKDPHRENHQSLGIGITRERLDLLNRSGFPGHGVEITDMEDADGHPLGTKVDLYFPIRRKSV